MDETANEIEAQINRTRERLGSNLRELEDKVDAATNWREHFKAKPHVFLGAAFVGGVVLAAVIGPRVSNRPRPTVAFNPGDRGHGSLHAQASELWNNIQGALVGVASARLKEYIGEFLPDFDEHYRRAEQRAAGDPTAMSLGRAPVRTGDNVR